MAQEPVELITYNIRMNTSGDGEHACRRVKLEGLKTGEILHVFNTHFDHKGELARRESAQLILDKVNSVMLSWSQNSLLMALWSPTMDLLMMIRQRSGPFTPITFRCW